MEEKLPLVHQYLILLVCVPFVASSHNVSTHVTSAHKSLKFFMKSVHRKHPIRSDTKSFSSLSNDIWGDAIPNSWSTILLVNISIGNPPVLQHVVMDTGSEIMWVQCSSCTKCIEEDDPLFDPSNSLTYRNLSCYSPTCPSHYSPNMCGLSNNCPYEITYADESRTSGTLGSDELHFRTSDEGTTSVDGVVFGCGFVNTVTFSADGSGILGLNADPLSLPSQLRLNFSYCIGNLSDHNYEYNQLILGNDAILEGDTTPFEVHGGHRYFTLEGISVGEEPLDIDPKIFQRSPSGGGGVIIDSGSTISTLPRVAYEKLKGWVSKYMGWTGWLLQAWGSGERLCYRGWLTRETTGVPVVTLHFADGADLVLGLDALFQKVDYLSYCMTFKPVDRETDMSVVGLYAQQYYNIGYDEDAKRIYIQRIDCELLED